MIEATIPLPPSELSPNARVHWAKRAKATKRHRFAAFVVFAAAKRDARWRHMRPIVLDVEYRCHSKAAGYKPKDTTNALVALKAAIDGLVDAGGRHCGHRQVHAANAANSERQSRRWDIRMWGRDQLRFCDSNGQ